jgi:site-specific DNA-cytosine methylase
MANGNGTRLEGLRRAGWNAAQREPGRSSALVYAEAERHTRRPVWDNARRLQENERSWSGRRLWPSRPGEPQHEWEASRLLESTVDASAYGLSGRLARWRRESIKAIGNSVVPQVVAEIGRAILEIKNSGLCGTTRHELDKNSTQFRNSIS